MKLIKTKYALLLCLPIVMSNCASAQDKKKDVSAKGNTPKETITLPAPYATESATKFADVLGWPDGKTPIAPDGYTVTRFAADLANPRWIYVGKNGDIFVAEATGKKNIQMIGKALKGGTKSANEKLGKTLSNANRITLFRDTNNDGVADTKSEFLTDLNNPFGMLILGNSFYVANNDAIMVYPYQEGQTSIKAEGKKVADIPDGGGHWTRNLIASKDGKRLYVSVGSGSNVGDKGMDNEVNRACILEMNIDGTNMHVYASGLRNPVGMAYAPGTNTLWTAVNERDGLGDDLVPDYITSVKEGGFYGWPYYYFGHHEDPRWKDKEHPDMNVIAPDVSMGAHTASLGLAFDEKNAFSGKYAGGAFIGQHGSWNRSTLSGYQVAFVPFKKGRPTGKMEPFLTGFIADLGKAEVYGRPVGVAFTNSGAMLVADDAANIIWAVRPNK